MKRWLLYLIIMGITVLSPIPKADIAKLSPVEVVWISEKVGQICLQTDTGEEGRGKDVPSALEDLKALAHGNVFLKTAEYVIVEQGREYLLEQCKDLLHPSCKVCTAKQITDVKSVAEFLTAHEPKVTLRQWQVEHSGLCDLKEQEGRFAWSGK